MGKHIGIEELRIKRSIDFSWSAVPDANGYIIALYQETPAGRRQIIQEELGNTTSWTLDKLSLLDRGNITWQLEAVIKNPSGVIEKRGDVGESSFVIDIPIPSEPSIRINESGSDGN